MATTILTSESKTHSDSGAVTAEFAVVLPTVFMILAISLGSMSAQLERVKMVSIAAMLSRGVARGEPVEALKQVFADQLQGRNFEILNTGLMVCVEVSQVVGVAGLSDLGLRLAETQCARNLGR